MKYLKKSEAAKPDTVTTEGISQLCCYLQHEEILQMRDLNAWLLVFVGTKAEAVIEVHS